MQGMVFPSGVIAPVGGHPIDCSPGVPSWGAGAIAHPNKKSSQFKK
jgi:hypothetical protein